MSLPTSPPGRTLRRAETAMPDPDELRRALAVLVAPGDVHELRALDVGAGKWKATHGGFYDDPDALARDAAELSRTARGVYVTLNPVTPALLARRANRQDAAGKGESATDANTLRRRWLLIDCDPARPAGISATDAEAEAARDRAEVVRDELRADGWPDPVVAVSGNGCHLLYRIDLPADDSGVVARCLQALDARHSDAVVGIDTTVGNASRIVRLYGTVARKGDSTPDRPHRVARLLDVPAALVPVPVGLLDALAAEATPDAKQAKPGAAMKANTKAATNAGTFDLDAFLNRAGLTVKAERAKTMNIGRGTIYELDRCPWNAEHADGEAWIFRAGDGTLAAGCPHNGCAGKGWRELRATVDRRQPTDSQAATPAAVTHHQHAPAERPTPHGQASPRAVPASQPFPADALPPAAAELVRQGAAAFGCDAGFVAALVLPTLAAAAGRSVRAVVKAGSWREPAALWCGLLAESGSMKSPVFDAATAPAVDLQREAGRDHAEAMERYAEAVAEWKSHKPADRGSEPDAPKLLDVLLMDFTAEAVAAAMQTNPRGVLIVRDELSAVLGGIGRFGQGRAEGDAAALLELHRGGMMKANRASKATVMVPDGLASMAGTTQPATFARLLGAGGIDQVENGMMGRFLWCRPEPPSDDWTDADIDPGAAEDYAGLWRAMYAMPLAQTTRGPGPHDCRVTAGAMAELRAWCGVIADRRRELRLQGDGAGALLAAWGKMRGAAVRLALVLHAADCAATGGGSDLPADAMRRGIRIARWFANEGERVYGMLSESSADARLRRLAEAVARDFGRDVTVRDYQRKHHRRLATAKAARAELAELVTARHGALKTDPPPPGGGNQSETFRLNPPVTVDTRPDSDAPAGRPSPSPLSPPADATPTPILNGQAKPAPAARRNGEV